VYYLRSESRRGPLVWELLERAFGGSVRIHVPGIVQLELLVGPYRSGSREDLADVIALTEERPGVRTAPISKNVLIGAARVRAMTNLKIPDALVVASASAGRCEGIVGNDSRFAVLNELRTLKFGADEFQLPRYVHLDDYAT